MKMTLKGTEKTTYRGVSWFTLLCPSNVSRPLTLKKSKKQTFIIHEGEKYEISRDRGHFEILPMDGRIQLN
jgi:hypothetical protein